MLQERWADCWKQQKRHIDLRWPINDGGITEICLSYFLNYNVVVEMKDFVLCEYSKWFLQNAQAKSEYLRQ